jgi:hypothetical protein
MRFITFTECFKLSIDALNQEPMCHERYVLMEIVNGHRNVSAASSQLNIREAGQDKVQAKIGDWTSVQVQCFNL